MLTKFFSLRHFPLHFVLSLYHFGRDRPEDLARLTINGAATVILGDIQAFGAGNIVVNAGSVTGGISVLSSGNVVVGAPATVGSVNVMSSGAVTVRGSTGTLNVGMSGAVNLNGANVPFGVLIDSNTAATTICGSTIGGISQQMTGGGLLIGVGSATVPCATSQVLGAVLVSKGTGAVRIRNAVLDAADVLVSENVGNVELLNVSVSDVGFNLITGSVSLTNVRTDSDSSIEGTTASVVLTNCSFQGDVKIITDQAVTLTGNDFNLEDTLISGGTGTLTLRNNINLGISITERGTVNFIGNIFTQAIISKSGNLVIRQNTGLLLDCVDNLSVAAATGLNANTIDVTLGQCAQL